jgi:hypothetical protein
MFAGKAGAYQSEEPERCFTWGRLLPYPRTLYFLGKALQGTKILAFYENS